MKFLSFIIPATFLFCGTIATHAQTTGSTATQQLQQHNARLMHAIEARQQARIKTAQGSTAKTTNTSERLVATSYYFSTGSTSAVFDSAYYIYNSTHRSSSFNFDEMDYVTPDLSCAYLFSPYPMEIYSTGNLTFSDRNDAPEVLYDTCLSFSGDTDQIIASYDTGNNIAQLYNPYTQSLTFPYQNDWLINTYDVNGNIKSCTTLNWNLGTWDSSIKRLLTYNNNLIATDTLSAYNGGTWTPLYAWNYTYDNAGNITDIIGYRDSSGTWLGALRFMFTYNGNNTLQQDSISSFVGSWSPNMKDSVGNTAGLSYITYEKVISYTGASDGTQSSYAEVIKHISNGLPDSVSLAVYEMPAGNIAVATHSLFTYDSYGNPLIDTQYDYNTGTGTFDTTPDYLTYYYYQTFTLPTTAVSSVAKQNINIIIYPNPATNTINIAQTGMQPGALTNITLINALGQTVHSEGLPFMSNTETISVAGLIAGNYWVLVQDKAGNVLSRQMIVKE